ncbi:MAG: protoporphyrinogen oxidase [Candidatus Marinimicrobia bacterium]|nr:protoporphyrinogen oxidase [Candidatus Neomarinimicrobiota bacterium]
MKVAVLGAGISGLAAAWRLDNLGHDVTVLESSSTTGGMIKTDQQGKYLLEAGPHAIMPNYKALLNALPDLGLMDSYIEAGANGRNRFICLDGRPEPIPMGPISFLRTPLLSFGAKLRVLKEPFIAPLQADESVAAFFTRRMGPEVVTRLIDPFISGVYAGDPDRLSIASALPIFKGFEREGGSIIKGALKRMRTARKHADPGQPKERRRRNMYSFKRGLQEIPQALARRLGDRIRLHTPVEELQAIGDNWSVNGESFDAVISTIPTHTWAGINGHLYPHSGLEYASVTTVHLAYPKSAVKARTDGFGMLIPAVEQRRILGILFDSSLFPNRAPEDQQLFTIFMGGLRNTWTVAKPVAELLQIAHREVADLMKVEGIDAPLFSHGHRWTHAIPQYDFNHPAAEQRLNKFENAHKNFVFAGNYRKGISVGHCFESGLDAAQRLIANTDS